MKKRTLRSLEALGLLLVPLTGCGDDTVGATSFDPFTTAPPMTETGMMDETGESGAEESTGDGDGDPATGDGDGDPMTGDGDGDPMTGDGDGDPTTGDETTGEECMTGDTMPCYTGPEGTEGVGVCAPGLSTCFSGEWNMCMQDITPSEEVCNGLDDDCNGLEDDGELAGIGDACNTGLQGICASGIAMCNEGEELCVPNNQPGNEICFNNQDDDCDGVVDENCFCPYVYAFDGQRWSYETSIGGASLIGRPRHLQAGRGKRVRFTPLWARLDGARVLDDRSVQAQVLAAEDETVYFDHAELSVVHHQPGHEVISSSAMRWAVREQRDPQAFWSFATDACRVPEQASWCGELDQREALSTLSGTPAAYALGRQNRYELDFGSVEDSSQVWLLVDGWTFRRERGIAKALRQQRPTVEIRQADGSWRQVKTIGWTRGDRKTLAVDLSQLDWPTGRYELRLSTGTQGGGKTVWCLDRVRLVEAAPAPVELVRVGLSRADLDYRGAPTLLDPRPDTPRVSRNDGGGELATAEGPGTYGRFTRYGEVTPLLESSNDQLVVMRQGDLVTLHFEDIPATPEGLETSLFLGASLVFKPRVVVGRKHPTELTQWVEPMPRHGLGRYELGATMERDRAYLDYLARWNTREVYPHQRRLAA